MFDTTPVLECGGRVLTLDRPRVMGIVNVTPDSFSDGGLHDTADAAIAHALSLVEQGGRIAGKRTGQGVSYDLVGNSFYAAKQGASLRLHGTATIGGKAYNYDYFGYLMPSWGVGGNEPDTIVGTVLRSDPANPSNAPLIASFAATREATK